MKRISVPHLDSSYKEDNAVERQNDDLNRALQQHLALAQFLTPVSLLRPTR